MKFARLDNLAGDYHSGSSISPPAKLGFWCVLGTAVAAYLALHVKVSGDFIPFVLVSGTLFGLAYVWLVADTVDGYYVQIMARLADLEAALQLDDRIHTCPRCSRRAIQVGDLGAHSRNGECPWCKQSVEFQPRE